ncbi:hypothetical protein IV203_033120 [Nitzschia inconspicua]|uniref:Uncharacterized protein n=1 Tax=Nitzschia inconspicua TaxID=303405 RepID=A0A9K3KKT4_9STRA|nr:hypothetical protein IV203_033120 [Nitzschia inconspicua]
MGWDDGDTFSRDPFGDPSSDCFGNAIEDVDPFLEGNDSFGGDKEWTAFNDDGSEHENDSTKRRERARQSSSKSSRDLSRAITKSGGLNGSRGSRSGQRPSSLNRQERPSTRTSASAKRTHSSGGRCSGHVNSSRTGRNSPSPVTSASGRRRDHRASDPVSFDSFLPEDAGDNPFRIGMDSPGTPSSARKKYSEGNSGFADFDACFDGPPPPPIADSPSSIRKSSASLKSRHQAKVIHDRHGRAQRMTTREERSRNRHSESRRSTVKDSIFSSLNGFGDDEDADNNVGLSVFLNEKSGRSSGRQRRGASGNDSVGAHSTQSAPAANHGHYQQRQHRRGSTKSSSNDDAYAHGISASPRRSRPGRNLRGRLPPSGAQQRRSRSSVSDSGCDTAHQQHRTLSLDVAALAEHGHLEVVDGKMRLVLDVETLTR